MPPYVRPDLSTITFNVQPEKTQMRKVTMEEFYKVMGPLDVHPSIQPGPYPYTSLWKLRQRPDSTPLGKSVGRMEGGQAVTDYFLNT
jgi:hypothetical protein